MSALFFLLRRRAVNWLKNLHKAPSQLIFVIIIVLFALSPLLARIGRSTPPRLDPNAWGPMLTRLIIWLIFILLGTGMMVSGIKKGIRMFTREDVQFLFCSPIEPHRILAYGMIGLLKSVALSIFIVIYQIPNLIGMGVSAGGIVGLILVFSMLMIAAILTGMAAYCAVSRRPFLKPVLNAVMYAAPLLAVAGLAYPVINGLRAGFPGGMAAAFPAGLSAGAAGFEQILGSTAAVTWVDWIPVIGWSAGAANGALFGMQTAHWIQAGLLLAFMAGLALYITRVDVFFYEQAMFEAETAESKRQKLGQTGSGIFRQQSKTWDTTRRSRFDRKNHSRGINRGQGVWTIYCRQRLEERRRRPFLIGVNTVIISGLLILLGVVFKSLAAPVVAGIALGVSAYDLIFFMSTSTFQEELQRDDFFYLPGRPVSKIAAASLSGIVSRLIDILPGAAVLLALTGLGVAQAALFLLCILSLILAGQAEAVIVTALLGGKSSGGLYNLLMGLGAMVFLMPTMIGAGVNAAFPQAFFLIFGIVTALNLALSVLILPVGSALLKRGRA